MKSSVSRSAGLNPGFADPAASAPPGAAAATFASPETGTPPDVEPTGAAIEDRFIRLDTPRMSYVVRVEDGELVRGHWGRRIDGVGHDSPTVERCSWLHPRTMALREYPDPDRGERRPAAFDARRSGHRVTGLRYEGAELVPGKPELPGRAGLYAEPGDRVSTVVVKMRDPETQLRVDLHYTLFEDHDAIARHAEFVNEGDGPLQLRSAMSWSGDFPAGRYRTLQLSGEWARERHPVWRALTQGTTSVSTLGGVAGHTHAPFLALLADGPDEPVSERRGEVFGLALADSGSFLMEATQSSYGAVRVNAGLNPAEFERKLEKGERFVTPECIGVFSAEGLGGMSRRFHRLFRERLVRGPWRDVERPILGNTWEGLYFKVRAEDVLAQFRTAKSLGVELGVLDDGWFLGRDDDTSSLGDWTSDPRKLPEDGVFGLGRRVTEELGMRFGLWFEPEMVNEKSALAKAHPEWILNVPGQVPTELRHQKVLDLTRKDVQDFIIATFEAHLGPKDGQPSPISYVKWDFNRPLTDLGSAALPPERQMELVHRYGEGLRRVQREITERHPEVLFEGCASGGARYAPDQLATFPQYWTSDNTDGRERLRIQEGTSYVYPAITMGAHVSAVPNHQVGRTTPFAFRSHVAMCGNYGIELDFSRLSKDEQAEVAAHVAYYKDVRRLVQFGDQYRLSSPSTSNWPAVLYVDREKRDAVVFAFQIEQPATVGPHRLQLDGLEPRATYRVAELDRRFTGRDLMTTGLEIPFSGDDDSRAFRLSRA